MGRLRLAFFLAFKSIIRGSVWTLILIILVMSLSFANLILTPSILAGVTDAINKQLIETLYGNIVIDPPQDEYYLSNASRIVAKVSEVDGVNGVAPHLNSSAYFEYNWQQKASPDDKGQSGTWRVIGIDPERETTVTTIHKSLISGSYLSAEDRNKILLGVEIAGGSQAANQPFLTLGGVKVGDMVRLTYGG